MEAMRDFEEKVTCPYDNAHFIRKSRMAVHLVKCAKNHPDAEIVSCDFNSTHKICKTQLRYHHEHCEDRKKIESQILQEEGEDPSKFYPIRNVKMDMDEESWDNGPEHPGYNPAQYCAENNVIRHIDVQSSATKRNFRLEERERLNNIKSLNVSASKAGTRQAVPTPEVPSTAGISLDEDALHHSLLNRIKIGNQVVYETK